MLNSALPTVKLKHYSSQPFLAPNSVASPVAAGFCDSCVAPQSAINVDEGRMKVAGESTFG